jgi:hypothetical protein
MSGELEKIAELEGQVSDLEAQITDLHKKLEAAQDESRPIHKRATVLKCVVDLATATSAIMKRDRLTSRTEAMRRARTENPGLYDAFRSA